MDRREFFGLGGTAAAATVLNATPVGHAAMEAQRRELEDTARLLKGAFSGMIAQGGDQSHLPLSVSISSEFMEDYTAGLPLVSSYLEVAVPFASKDGTKHILRFNGYWDGVVPEMIELISSDPDPEKYPDRVSMTGWTVTSRTELPQAPTYSRHFFDAPRAVVVPATANLPAKLYIYRDSSVHIAELGDDGSIGNFYAELMIGGTTQVVSPVGEGTTWIPEIQASGGCINETGYRPPGCYTGPWLRDRVTNARHHINPDNLFSSPDQVIVKFFPLTSSSHDTYYAITLEQNGDVSALRLKLVGDEFQVDGRTRIGNSPNGLVAVHEPNPGTAEVFFFELPKVRSGFVNMQGQPGLLNTPPMRWGETSTQLQHEEMPNFPAGTTYRVFATASDKFDAVEVYFVITEPLTHPDGEHIADPLSELWTTTQGPKGWSAPMLIDKGLRTVDLVTLHQIPNKNIPDSDVTLCVSRPRTGFEFMTRNEDGDWDTEFVRVESETGQMIETAGYRVGITLKRGGTPVVGREFGLLATIATPAVIKGEHAVLSTHRPWPSFCDDTGTLWVTVLLEERLCFPQLIVTSAQFTDRLVLDLNHRIEEHLANVTPQQLLDARDPRHCNEEQRDGCSAGAIASGIDVGSGTRGVTDGSKADTAASIITKSLQGAPKGPELSKTSGAITVESRVPYGWLSASSDLSVLRPVRTAYTGPSWRMYRKDGAAHVELISSEDAKAHIARLDALYPRLHASFFDVFDAIGDALGDIANAVSDAFCTIGEAIVDGVKLAVTLTIDGLTFVYHAVVDTLDLIMDAIDFVLEYAGMALGMAVGWLLEQLGFLFDWKAIKARRDQLKGFLRQNLRPALNKLGSPVNGAAAIKVKLNDARRDGYNLLNTMRHTPGDVNAWKNAPAEGSTFSGFDFINGFSVMPQATWLLDKVMSVLPKNRYGLGETDMLPGLDASFTAFGSAMSVAADTMFSVFTDFLNFLDQELLQGKLVTAEAFDPLIELLQNLLNRTFTVINAVIDAGAKVLQIFWDSAEHVLEAFDDDLPAPGFFRGFYKGLSGNSMSALDLVCLMAAIPEAAESYESPNNTADAFWPQHGPSHGPHVQDAALRSGQRDVNPLFGRGIPQTHAVAAYSAPRMSTAQIVSAVFQGVGGLFGSASIGFQAFYPSASSGEANGEILGYVSKVCTFAAAIANLADDHSWKTVGATNLIAVVALVIAYRLKTMADRAVSPGVPSNWQRFQSKMNIWLSILSVVEIVFVFVDISEGSFNSGFVHMATALQFWLGVYVLNERSGLTGNLPGSTAVAAANGALAGGSMALYILRPLPDQK